MPTTARLRVLVAILLSACSSGHTASVPTPASFSPSISAAPTPTATVAAATPSPTRPAPSPSHSLPPAPGAAAVPSGKVVVIDPGHNGQNYAHTAEINRLVNIGNGTKACDTTGTAATDGYTESAYNLDLAQRLAALLRAAGLTVVLTRTTDSGWGPCIDERAAIGNRAHAAAAISIHADGSTVGRGFHVIYPASLPGLTAPIVAPSQRLALDVRDAYASGTGMPYATYIGHDGLDQRSDLGGLNLSTVPKVFIECGNLRNATDGALLESPAFRARVATALSAGIRAFLSG